MKKTKIKYLDIFIEKICDIIRSEEFKERSRMSKNDFIRNRKIGFQNLFVFILSNDKKSLQAGLNSFITKSKMRIDSYSKQAFSKKRMSIKPESFKEIYRESVKFINHSIPQKDYHGYQLFAIDGSRINLPCSDELKEIYGYENKTNGQPQALCSCMYDIQTQAIVDAVLYPHNANERKLVSEHLKQFDLTNEKPKIIVFDRGYPSAELLEELDKNNVKYIMRCCYTFISGIKTHSNDCIVTHQFKYIKNPVRLRVVKVNTGYVDKQILVTNIFEEFSPEELSEIYHMRWGIEEKYNDLKTKLQLENFSGTSNIAVLQDFYSTMFLNNMAVIAMLENEEELDKKNQSNILKYEYKQNRNIAFSELKENVVALLLTNSKIKQIMILKKIVNNISKSIVPIRANRSEPRKLRHYYSKFPTNMR